MAISKIGEELIQFQKKHELTDTQVAFESRFSVEKIHQIKSGEMQPNEEDIKRLTNYFNSKH